MPEKPYEETTGEAEAAGLSVQTATKKTNVSRKPKAQQPQNEPAAKEATSNNSKLYGSRSDGFYRRFH